MTTNEIIEMLETVLTETNELLKTAQNEQTCMPALLNAVSENIGVVLHLSHVLKEKRPLVTFADLLNELNRRYQDEMKCKNEAYRFILTFNAMEKFNQFTKSKK